MQLLLSLITYFAYGANLDKDTMTRRILASSSLPSYNGVVEGHRLAFNVPDLPLGPAAASIVKSESDKVHGVCYELTLPQYLLLCASEGVPIAYRGTTVMVKPYGEDTRRPVRAYAMGVSNTRATERQPSQRYISIIRKGARDSALQEEWCSYLDQIQPWGGQLSDR
jgi:hypothetical protein